MATEPVRMNATTRLSYGAGAVANGIKNTGFNTYLLLYFNQVIGVSAAIVATALALTLIIDAIADPLIGRVSDVTRSRWGRPRRVSPSCCGVVSNACQDSSPLSTSRR